MAHEMGDNPARDARRDRWLETRGFRVLRIAATEVGEDVEAVLLHILEACGRGPSTALRAVPLPTASPQGG